MLSDDAARRSAAVNVPDPRVLSRPMTLDSFVALVREATSGALLRGDTLYVSSALYARLTPAQCRWLWAHALEARAYVATDAPIDPPIVVRRGAAGAAAAAVSVAS